MVDKRICEMRLDNRKATDIAQLIKKLIATHTTISTMESCTSGLIASMITDTEGASAIFPGGYVTYLNETKIFIGVDPKVLERYGVYSKECAEAMARTVQEKLHTDIAVGITGTTGNLDLNNADSALAISPPTTPAPIITTSYICTPSSFHFSYFPV